MNVIEVWRKSTYSSGENGCVEIELVTRGRIRDSKNRQGPTLDVGQEAVDAFVESVRAGHFNG
jgi:hypothetical protein